MSDTTTIIGDSTLYQGDVLDVLRTLPDESVQCVVTSPPYWGLRDYGTAEWEGGDLECGHQQDTNHQKQGATSVRTGRANIEDQRNNNFRNMCPKCGARRIDSQIGLEETPELFVEKLVAVFREVRRALRSDGTLWLNLGDSYNAGRDGGHPGGKAQWDPKQTKYQGRSGANAPGLKPKDLCGIPWRVALALQSGGWWLRSDIIWAKCLSGGTRLYARTQKGDMPATLKDLVRLDPATVKLWNGNYWTQVVSWSEVPRPKHPTEITLRSGERIGCTAEHRWPTERGLLRADELNKGDVLTATVLHQPGPTLDPPFRLPNVDVGWFVGLYIAEGSTDTTGTIQIASHVNEAPHRHMELATIARGYDGTCHWHKTQGRAATICVESKVMSAILDTYISGRTAKTKHLTRKAWMRGTPFLRAVLDGYLEGDGHRRQNEWRIGFTQNDEWAYDLRCLGARLGLSVRLKRTVHMFKGRGYPGWRGNIRKPEHRRTKDTQIISIGKSRARKFWDVRVADAPHLFSLASGVLTHNSNPMPESCTDRPTKSHEYLFLLTKSAQYKYDADAIREPGESGPSDLRKMRESRDRIGGKHKGLNDPLNKASAATKIGQKRAVGNPDGRNKRSVWSIATQSYPECHFATFPEALVEPCILAGTKPGDTVLDPFVGSGTTGVVALRHECQFIGIDLSPEYIEMAEKRIRPEAEQRKLFAD